MSAEVAMQVVREMEEESLREAEASENGQHANTNNGGSQA